MSQPMPIDDALMKGMDDLDAEAMDEALRSGAKANCFDDEGDTPLHIMVDSSIDGTIQSGGSPGDEPLEFIEVLLRHGADIHLKNKKGASALDWAKKYRAGKVVSYITNFNS